MILVVGSTGSTGVHAVRELVQRGHRVRASARDLARARALHAAHGIPSHAVELVELDLEQPAGFARALEGVDRCYVAVGGPTGTPELVAVECRFIDAALRAGVRHYVKVSGFGARPDGASRIEQMHGAIGDHLIASGLPWTILEPSFFLQNFLGLAPAIRAGALPLPTGQARAGLIDARDIGEVAATVLTTPGHLGKRYLLTGPELLSHGQVAEVMSRVLGRPVAFADLPAPAFEASLVGAGLPPWFAGLLTDVYATFFRSGGAARLTGEVERLIGRPPRSLEAFLTEHRPAFEPEAPPRSARAS